MPTQTLSEYIAEVAGNRELPGYLRARPKCKGAGQYGPVFAEGLVCPVCRRRSPGSGSVARVPFHEADDSIVLWFDEVDFAKP